MEELEKIIDKLNANCLERETNDRWKRWRSNDVFWISAFCPILSYFNII